MAEQKFLPVQYDDGRYFISEEALNNHVKSNLEELRQHVLTKTDISNKKFTLVVILTVGTVGMVASLAFAGATFWAFVIALIALVDVKPILTFLEKNSK